MNLGHSCQAFTQIHSHGLLDSRIYFFEVEKAYLVIEAYEGT